MMRKGYVHALEGIIAALIITLYLTSMVSVPEAEDWTEARVSKQSEDLIAALDEAEILDKTVLRDDPKSFNAFMSAIDSSMAYTIKTSGLPDSHIDVGILVNDSYTVTASTTQTNNAPGAPATAYHREGTIRGVGFVISDTFDDGNVAYNVVDFDWDGDGTYESSSYSFSDQVTCPAESACAGEQYEVGPINTTLVLYQSSFAAQAKDAANTSLGDRPIYLDVSAANPRFERLDKFDALVTIGWSPSQLSTYRSSIESFLAEDNFLAAITDFSPQTIESTYLSSFGFDYIDAYQPNGTGPTTNVLYDTHSPKNESYNANNYYLETSIRLDDFSNTGSYRTGILRLQQQDITVRRSGGTVSFSTDSFAINYSAGDRVTLLQNTYQIASIDPFILYPVEQQRFSSFNTSRIRGDYYATRILRYLYNTTAYDMRANYTDSRQNRHPQWGNVQQSPCQPSSKPYRTGELTTVTGRTIPFLIVNFEIGYDPGTGCNQYFEYAYFNLNSAQGDQDFEDAREGPYQRDDKIRIGKDIYTVRPFANGNGTALRKDGPRIVGEIPVQTNVVSGGGQVALINRHISGHDDLSLLRSLILAGTTQRTWFTAPQNVGGESYGYTYTDTAQFGHPQAYILHTVWWLE